MANYLFVTAFVWFIATPSIPSPFNRIHMMRRINLLKNMNKKTQKRCQKN